MADNYFYALGRRKRATARVRITPGKVGSFKINNKEVDEYLSASKTLSNKLFVPFVKLDLNPTNYVITARVAGSGHSAQVEAIQLGIAKALVAINEDYRGTLKKADLLGRDPRERERKKFGLKGARKKRQFTKR